MKYYVVMGAHTWASLVRRDNKEPIEISGENMPTRFMPVFDSKEEAKEFCGGRFDIMEFNS